MTASDPLLSAWLDGEVSSKEAARIEAELARDPVLAFLAGEMRGQDDVLREWYASLPAQATAAPRVLRKALRAAAAVLLAGLSVAWLLIPGTAARAEEALERTWSRVSEAKGILVEYRILSHPEGLSLRSATGYVRIDPIGVSGMPVYFSRERQEGSDGEEARIREWRRSATGYRSLERDASTVIFLSDDVPACDMPRVDLGNGSPVDLREGRSAPQLVQLLRGFHREGGRPIRWGGQEWLSAGGSGSEKDPWVYRAQPFGAVRVGNGLVWTLKLSENSFGIIDRIVLEEWKALLPPLKAARPLLRTECRLTLLGKPWTPAEMDGTAPEAERRGAEEEGKGSAP